MYIEAFSSNRRWNLILLWDFVHCWIPLRSSVLSGCAGNASPAGEQRTALSVTSAKTWRSLVGQIKSDRSAGSGSVRFERGWVSWSSCLLDSSFWSVKHMTNWNNCDLCVSDEWVNISVTPCGCVVCRKCCVWKKRKCLRARGGMVLTTDAGDTLTTTTARWSSTSSTRQQDWTTTWS